MGFKLDNFITASEVVIISLANHFVFIMNAGISRVFTGTDIKEPYYNLYIADSCQLFLF